MTDWRERILNEFSPGIGKVILVADSDRLFTEPKLSETLTSRGFDLLLFEDPIAFRFAYELKYRSLLDAGRLVDLVVLLDGDASSLQSLPFDVLVKSRSLAFALSDFFPNLSYPVLTALEPEYLDLLYEAQTSFTPGLLGENATKDFILRHVFEIAAELIKSEADLLRVLLRKHYRLQVIPPLFLDRLIDVLTQTRRFGRWPLRLLFEGRVDFLTFLQERWPLFLNRTLSGSPSPESRLMIDGPAELPFDDPDVRVYMDNLFLEGLLQPIDWPGSKDLSAGWFLIGVRRDPEKDRALRITGLLDVVERSLPSVDSRHDEWIRFAATWAQLLVLVNQGPIPGHDAPRFFQIRELLDSIFKVWIEKRFGPLYNLPASPPVAVHHLARHLANVKSQLNSKIALVVVDGLAFDQWLVMREELSRQKPRWEFEETGLFAWIPTITSVSRQTIFAGRAPLYFASSIYGTAKEASLWSQFWADHGLSASEIGYLKGLGDPSSLQAVDEIVQSSAIKVLGLVVDKVDYIMHGMELGTTGMHNQVKLWVKQGFIGGLFETLLSNGFGVYVTSDHGNVESVGCGRPKEGVLAELRGERVRIYSDNTLRSSVAERFAGTLAWKPLGLPEDFLPLLAKGRTAFVTEGQRTVAHGGITIEETIVPLVRIFGGQR